MHPFLRPTLSPRIRSQSTPPASRHSICGLYFCLMKITEDVRQYVAEQAISEEEALQHGMAEKPKEFVEAGAEVYLKS